MKKRLFLNNVDLFVNCWQTNSFANRRLWGKSETEKRKGKGPWLCLFLGVMFQCPPQSFHPRPSCDSPGISLIPSLVSG